MSEKQLEGQIQYHHSHKVLQESMDIDPYSPVYNKLSRIEMRMVPKIGISSILDMCQLLHA
jgi:hypothetical protein